MPFSLAREIILRGLPIFLNEFLWAGGMAFMTQSYSLRGLRIIAASNIANALCNLFNVVFIAMGNAVGILVGQMLGAADYSRAKKDSVLLMRFTALLTAAVSVLLIAGAWFFPYLYNTTDEIRGLATGLIMLTALFFPLQGYLNALYFTLRAGGKTVITFLFDSVFTWVIPAPIAFILCRYTGLSIYAIFITVQCCDILKTAIGLILFRRDIWVTNLVGQSEPRA